MTRPLIGIPTFHDTSLPEKLPARFAMSRPYITALEATGAAPILLPLDLDPTTLRSLFDRIDGLFLAGGGDVNPSCYGMEKYDKTEGIDNLRDETELLLTQWALDEDKPLLGVCRGVQTLNVAAGGTLFQDISDLLPDAIRHQYYPEFTREYVAHDISTTPGTRLAGILGDAARVNSFHHQALAEVANGFHVAALAPDGVIEAIEGARNQFAIGVQWHPESLIDADQTMYRLFEAFVNVA
jgi:putative glutamine amidotransferase